ncbi:50S ribosomal subunit protein L4 [Gammaproteobacteria bacterium]
MELSLYDTKNPNAAFIEVADAVFGQQFNEPLIHQVVTAYLAAGRSGTKAQKSRAEVRGGGRKPWRQKGTGRARAGTSRSPLWRAGGRTFAARPRDYTQKVNRKMYRGAMRSILSELVRQNRLLVVDEIRLASSKTRDFLSTLKGVAPLLNTGLDHVLVLVDTVTEELTLASRNLSRVGVAPAMAVDPVSLVDFEKILVTVGALRQIEKRFLPVS